MIDRLLRGRGPAPGWVAVDAGHDCAVTADGTALTVDTMVEAVHFDPSTPPADVGYKAVAVSVSDLAAARARPEWVLLSLSLPRAAGEAERSAWVDGFATGVTEACAAFGVYLLGGDVTGSPGPVVVSTTAGGACAAGARTRAGARPGDDLWVTGWPGLAGAGWMSHAPPPEAVRALRRPSPPLAFALALDDATAAMDLSDGIGADVARLAAASGVALVVTSIPAHPAIADSAERLRWQIGGGDDYQLLFTAPPEARDRIEALGAAHQVSVHRIGEVRDGAGATLPGEARSFAHFEEGER